MNESATVQPSDPFAEEELATLIEWLDLGEGEEWQGAARSLYLRYHVWLFRRLYKPLNDFGILDDVVLETIGKVVRESTKFRRIKDEDPDDTRKRFEGWMLKIAKRIAQDHFRKSAPAETRDAEFWEAVAVDASEPMADAPASAEVEAARELLAEFSEREQVILRAAMEHCPDITNPQSKLPRNVLQELSESFGTTKANIRTIKSRALARFKTKLSERGIRI
ncbi:MAG: sigma-70 family RNA polymerase sigma factor [Parvularcula sp.]|jgi:RNA polymerase sigma factor (sigma-70 family)|nr:sigma-70 family RNA polymerase sigma factor [Parvularcula sp.]